MARKEFRRLTIILCVGAILVTGIYWYSATPRGQISLMVYYARMKLDDKDHIYIENIYEENLRDFIYRNRNVLPYVIHVIRNDEYESSVRSLLFKCAGEVMSTTEVVKIAESFIERGDWILIEAGVVVTSKCWSNISERSRNGILSKMRSTAESREVPVSGEFSVKKYLVKMCDMLENHPYGVSISDGTAAK